MDYTESNFNLKRERVFLDSIEFNLRWTVVSHQLCFTKIEKSKKILISESISINFHVDYIHIHICTPTSNLNN